MAGRHRSSEIRGVSAAARRHRDRARRGNLEHALQSTGERALEAKMAIGSRPGERQTDRGGREREARCRICRQQLLHCARHPSQTARDMRSAARLSFARRYNRLAQSDLACSADISRMGYSSSPPKRSTFRNCAPLACAIQCWSATLLIQRCIGLCLVKRLARIRALRSRLSRNVRGGSLSLHQDARGGGAHDRRLRQYHQKV